MPDQQTPSQPHHIAVVEDETVLRDLLVDFLSGDGWRATGVASGSELESLQETDPVDAIVLDVNLPGENGFAVASRLRLHPDPPPIIMLTARASVEDRIAGLDAGADVYLTKDGDLKVLSAHLRSALRRREASGATHHTGWHLETTGWRLIAPNGKETRLTVSEHLFLSLVMRESGRLWQREEVASALSKSPSQDTDRAISVLATRLRQKVKAATGVDLPVRSMRGGYFFGSGAKARR